jgi:fatty acid desaturase
MSSGTVNAVTFTKTRPGGDRTKPTSAYSALLNEVRNAGLLKRRIGFYISYFTTLTALLAGLITAMFLLGDSWWQLAVAAGFGVIFTQFAHLAHESAHRQVFESGKLNDKVGRVLANLFVGISYQWWMRKHSRHHANPNVVGKDPDLDPDFIVFREADAAKATGLYAWVLNRQGYLFFPVLIFEGVNLHIHGFRTAFGSGKVDSRGTEIAMLLVRAIGFGALVFWLLPIGLGIAFLGVQMAVFGVYMGASFAPNHKGMPVLPHDSKVDFLSRQVLTSRNITGNRLVDTFMGGLNYQAEHHLFPNMPRPHLKAAAKIVREYCAKNGIVYTETSLLRSYAIVIEYLNRVGLAAGGDAFDCPAAKQFGR